jgi:hypothetical protein
MKNLLYVTVLISLVLVSSSFAADANATNQTVPDLAAVKQFAKSFVKIERGIMDSKNPDWAAINAQFELTLPVIKYTDAKYKTQYADKIAAALKKLAAGRGRASEFNGEVVEKSYAQITVLAIEQQLDLMGKAEPSDMKTGAKKIAAYFDVIRPVYDDIFESEKKLETQADAAIAKLQNGDKSELLIASRQLDDVISRTYALSVVYEASEAEKNREIHPDLAARHRFEATMCYQIIQPRIEKHSPKTNEVILTMLNGNLNTISSQELEKNLTTGLDMKLR